MIDLYAISEELAKLRAEVAKEKERADYAWRNTQAIDKVRQAELANRDKLVRALTRAESFISGFEDDEAQEGIAELLGEVRTALDRFPIPKFLRRPHG